MSDTVQKYESEIQDLEEAEAVDFRLLADLINDGRMTFD